MNLFGGIPQAEIDELKTFWSAFPNLRTDLFIKSDIPYTELAVEDIKTAVKNHGDVQNFIDSFKQAFNGFEAYLKSELLEKMSEISISKEESIISEDIFKRLQKVALIDKYEAYQLLDNEWSKIAIDLEIIQTEGFSVTKKVDPNMVIKKKDGKEQEIQDGWIGHVIPFELVQNTLLKSEYAALKAKETRMAEISAEYEEIIDSMTEEEKETDVLNDSNDAFAAKAVSMKLKELLSYSETEDVIAFKEKLQRVENLIKEEKTLKSNIKREIVQLQSLTKATIEHFTDEQVYMLLEKKWIDELSRRLEQLPDNVVNDLISKLQSLYAKYATTYAEVAEEIKETEQLLCSMIDELDGNEFDMKGLGELKTLLIGEEHGRE